MGANELNIDGIIGKFQMEILTHSDSEKWAKFRNGDNQVFAEIYSLYAGKLFQYGLKITANQSIVEDAIQDLFSDLIKNRSKLGTTDNILFYLLKSFKRKLLRYIHKEKRFDNLHPNEGYDFNVTYSIEQEIISNEVENRKNALLLSALKELTPRQKEAIYLKYSQELEYKEISAVMEMSVESSRNLISKAIKILKESIQKNGQKSNLLLFSLLLRRWKKDESPSKFSFES